MEGGRKSWREGGRKGREGREAAEPFQEVCKGHGAVLQRSRRLPRVEVIHEVQTKVALQGEGGGREREKKKRERER
jgi:hypothetical protein